MEARQICIHQGLCNTEHTQTSGLITARSLTSPAVCPTHPSAKGRAG